MTTPQTIAMLALLVAIPLAFGIGLRMPERRRATPREPDPEPGPQGKTPADLQAEIWGDDFEAKRKTGGLPGLREERAEIIRRLKREHVEMQMLDPSDDGFAAEYDHRMQMKDNYRRQLLALDAMLKGNT